MKKRTLEHGFGPVHFKRSQGFQTTQSQTTQQQGFNVARRAPKRDTPEPVLDRVTAIHEPHNYFLTPRLVES
ncbi:MAG: hypothetical protein ACQESR_01135 [Planctomycetota bacterium]